MVSLIRTSGGRLPKRIAFGNRGAVQRRRGENEKEGTDCVQGDVQVFGIACNLKVTALEAEVWVETATESWRRFIAAWREEEKDAAEHRHEKREKSESRKFVIVQGSEGLRRDTDKPVNSRRAEGILYEQETDRDLCST